MDHLIQPKLPSEVTLKQLNSEFIRLLRSLIESGEDKDSQRVFLADNHNLKDQKIRNELIAELDTLTPSPVRTMFRVEIESNIDVDHLYEGANDLITTCFHRQLAAIEAGMDLAVVKYMFFSSEYIDELQMATSSEVRNMVVNGSLMATFRLLQPEMPIKSLSMLLG